MSPTARVLVCSAFVFGLTSIAFPTITKSFSPATVVAANPPTIVKAFDATTIPLNGSAFLSFTLNNSDDTVTVNGLAFTDKLPASLTLYTPGNLTKTCNGKQIVADV